MLVVLAGEENDGLVGYATLGEDDVKAHDAKCRLCTILKTPRKRIDSI